MSIAFNLVCWSCGKSVAVEAEREPGMAFELGIAAESVDWLGIFDFNRNRLLVFCGDACKGAQLTKAGTFRLRPVAVQP